MTEDVMLEIGSTKIPSPTLQEVAIAYLKMMSGGGDFDWQSFK